MIQLRLSAVLVLLAWLPPALPAQEVMAVVGPSPGPYRAAFDSFAAAFGRPFTAVHLPKRPQGVPDALRTLVTATVDALWLPPDPRVVTPQTFQTIVQFTFDNHLPFYASTRGLTADLARRALGPGGEALP